jgi:DNA-directed RNA polymerase specialized sigma24 family protein
VHEILLGMLRDRADADEALQQVFLKLLEAWESVRLSAWHRAHTHAVGC